MKKSDDNMKVSVSILKEYDRLIRAVNKVNESKADFLHIDVMDGKFVDNEKFPYEVAKDIISISKKKIDMHLMVQDKRTIKKYAELLPDYLTFHGPRARAWDGTAGYARWTAGCAPVLFHPVSA